MYKTLFSGTSYLIQKAFKELYRMLRKHNDDLKDYVEDILDKGRKS